MVRIITRTASSSSGGKCVAPTSGWERIKVQSHGVAAAVREVAEEKAVPGGGPRAQSHHRGDVPAHTRRLWVPQVEGSGPLGV